MALAPNRALILRNVRCAYCGAALTKQKKTKDHVIGRRFVPKGKLNGEWNLILNACQLCNNKKSDLEDDIAAITLLPDLTGRFAHEDVEAMAEASRKAFKSISRKTGKPVSQSHENLNLIGHLGVGCELKFNFTSPPQIEESRAFELARLHLTALFFMQTFNADSRTGGWWLHGFHPVKVLRHEDWGNPLMHGFMKATENWDCRLFCITADGFFKAVTRRSPTAECWSWAVEWNNSLRVFGFFGLREPAQQIVNDFPREQMRTMFESKNNSIRYAVETALAAGDDILFECSN